MKNKNGFVSMTTILTLVLTVSSLLLLNLTVLIDEKALTNKIKDNSRNNIKSSDEPYCYWSDETTLVIPYESKDKKASGTVSLNCYHPNTISLKNDLTLEGLANKELYKSSSDYLSIDEINPSELSGGYGYKIIFSISSTKLTSDDNYYTITLNEDLFCYNNICNEEVVSNKIKVAKEYNHE